MKYIELDYERDVIRVYRPLNISPTNYLTMKVYKLTSRRVERLISSKLYREHLRSRNIAIYW